jgi:hypothetical protein
LITDQRKKDIGMIAQINTAESIEGIVLEITGVSMGMAIQEVLMRDVTLATTRMKGEIPHGGCDRSAEDAYSFTTPDSTFAFVGGPCCPTLDFVIAFWIMIYVLHIVNFAILYPNKEMDIAVPSDSEAVKP